MSELTIIGAGLEKIRRQYEERREKNSARSDQGEQS